MLRMTSRQMALAQRPHGPVKARPISITIGMLEIWRTVRATHDRVDTLPDDDSFDYK
jgi:hypothetical protein